MELDKRLQSPNYKNCLANIPNSVLKYFGVPTVGDTLPQLDKLLENEYENVVLFLLDGMGTYILEETLAPDGFLRSHFRESISSVFLATTVAATTSAMSGLQPCEHSWLGWDCYYPSVDKNVTVFLNTVQGTYDQAAPYNIARTVTPYQSVVSRINSAGGQAYDCFPFMPPFPGDMEHICGRLEKLCGQPGKKYIYCYWSEPDTTLHKRGRGTAETRQVLTDCENLLEKTARKLKNTLLIVTADHGHI
nr:alkaline phosphatase family protein [Ruminococcus sp.]